ncbi:hypothetical protein LTR08_000506 [Meristemomyces frigidus]|nr:hypothetical protein LTR08_000506 [Meristemomyces frigidus]
MTDVATQPPSDARPPKQVVYCGVCSLPPEVGTTRSPPDHLPHPPTNPQTNPSPTNQYCENGGTTAKCSDWLSTHHPRLHAQIYDPNAAAASLSTLSVDAQKRAEKDAHKKALKATAAEAKEAERLASSKIIIKRVERNKRKYVTEISGLEAFGLDLKTVAKTFGKKFATGSSVTKAAGGVGEEITVQGDVSEEVVEWLGENHEEIPERNVEVVEAKKKKEGAAV